MLAKDASRHTQATVSPPIINVLNVPFASGNPYQKELMYAASGNAVSFLAGGKNALSKLEVSKHSILHLHWDDRIFGRSKDPAENQAFLKKTLAQLKAYQNQGGRILWTIHNRQPHKIIDMSAFTEARRGLVEICDDFHVHAPHAADHIITTYGVDPQKIHIIPHPSYLGIYEASDTTSKRKYVHHEKRRFLFFGMFRGSKGIVNIYETAVKFTKRNIPYTLKMYGKAFGSQRRLLRKIGWNPNIDLYADRVPDKEVAQLFSSSDVFLAPSSSLFSSGSIMLAQTFGLPVIGPDTKELRETTPEACHPLLYDPQSPRGLIRAMLKAVEMDHETFSNMRTACLDFSEKRSPIKVSKQLILVLSNMNLHKGQP